MRVFGIALIIGAAMMLSHCATAGTGTNYQNGPPQASPMVPRATTSPALPAVPVGPRPSPTPMVGTAFQTVSIGLDTATAEIPAGWVQQGGTTEWGPPDGAAPQLGVHWQDIVPGWNTIGMLPPGARIMDQVPIDLGWITATRYRIIVPPAKLEHGGIVEYQEHLIIDVGRRRAYDFYSRANTRKGMEAAGYLLEHMVISSTFSGS